MSHPIVAALVALPLFVSAALAADPGVSADRILFGQAAVLDGPTKALGTGMREGILAAFGEANAKGGVNGRKIELKSADDGYEPEKSIEATKSLIENDKVFALVGAVGTPTSAAAQPIAGAAGVPFIGPFTGAAFLRDAAKLTNVVNVRASYDQETEAWVERLTKDLGYDKIAILYQDDSYGRAGLDGVNKALTKRGMKLVAEGTYQRNTTAVRQALLSIRQANPQAVVIVGAYKPVAEFIKTARRVKMEAVFINISFVGPEALAAELGNEGAGVVVTQVVPLATDMSIPLVQRFHAALKATDPQAVPSSISLEGYLVGRLVVETLAGLDGEPTRKGLLEKIAATNTDFGGIRLTYGAGDNQGSDAVFLTVIQADGSFKAVDSLKN